MSDFLLEIGLDKIIVISDSKSHHFPTSSPFVMEKPAFDQTALQKLLDWRTELIFTFRINNRCGNPNSIRNISKSSPTRIVMGEMLRHVIEFERFNQMVEDSGSLVRPEFEESVELENVETDSPGISLDPFFGSSEFLFPTENT